MEEKLAEYQRKKKEKAALSNDKRTTSSINLNRSLRSSTKPHKELGKESSGITKSVVKPTSHTTRNRVDATKTTVTLVQTDISQSFQQSNNKAQIEEADTKSVENSVVTEKKNTVSEADITSEAKRKAEKANDKSSTPEDKEQAENSGSETKPNIESVDVQEVHAIAPPYALVSKETSEHTQDTKPIIKDRDQRLAEKDTDDIHPLARTVVVAKPLTHCGPIKPVPEQDTYTSKPLVLKPVHAYSRAEEKIKDSTLPMPGHMKALFAIFKALEELIVFTKSQGQLCFFHRLKRPVELQSSRNFEIKHLAQLRTLWQDGYKFSQAPCLFEGQRVQSILIEQLAPKEEPTGYFVPRVERRRAAFSEHMQEYIHQYHKTFLISSDPPRTDTYPHSWHPDFDLESVPPIPEGDVPLLKPVTVNSSKLNLMGLNSRRGLETGHSLKKNLAVSSSSLPSPASSTTSSPSSGEPTQPGTKPLTALEQLKEKIRLKQLAHKESTVGLATPEEKQRRLVASRLPAVFDLIRFKRVEVMSFKALTEQVVKSSRMPISEQEGKQSLEMLADKIPEWCSVFSLNDGMYFKVLKKAEGEHDIRALRSRLVSGVLAK
ncbi:hypothetical protein BG004_003262 [Podila humilis]|nr:hypothetical protein BG004_003262 [Podila humilis]